MSLAAKLRRAVTLARWDHPQRILVDGFVSRCAKEVPPEARILDAGAGECRYAPAFAHCNYIACDRAVGDTAWDYTHIDVVADVSSLPFRNGTFDAVLSANVLEHVSEPAAALRDIVAVLKPGGRLYMSAPFLGDPIHQEPYDFFRYTQYGLRHLIENAGLTPVSISPMGGVFFLACSCLWWCAVIFRTSSWKKLRIVETGFLVAARFCTMVAVALRQTETGSQHFACGYAVIAEKQ
jgi:SAM-dependent methyltransferase